MVAPAARAPRYWQAEAFAATILAEFEAARRSGDAATVRDRFYVLAAYYRRTLAILHSGFDHKREPLVAAALKNLIVLQHALSKMREAAPHTSLSTLALETDLHRRLNRDLVYRILRDAGGPLQVATLVRRFNDLNVIGDARIPAITRAATTLVQTGHAIERDGRYSLTNLPYVDANVDWVELSLLFGPALAQRFATQGFDGLSQVPARAAEFEAIFSCETGFGHDTATLVLASAETLSQVAAVHGVKQFPHAELAGSAYPRPYQRLLHAIFRARRYAGQVIEAPTGSGKTMVGMLCIEDWLRTMAPGQSVLVLVPTVSYQRQWVGELCLKEIGLRLAPDLVYAGTPGGIDQLRRQSGAPAVLVITYAALARIASGIGKSGFDGDAIERFLQANAVRHVILDEVHKVVADLSSVMADCVRLLLRWMDDGSLASVIGFSGTLATFRKPIKALGLHLATELQTTELITQGWVAPFAELGAPFNYSERERAIIDLTSEYKTLLRAYLDRIGGDRLRGWFAGLAEADRVRAALRLGMYAGHPDAPALAAERLRRWETCGALRLDEILLVSIVQVVRGWSDSDLIAAAGIGEEAGQWIEGFAAIRERLLPLLPPGVVRQRLSVEGFGFRLDTQPLDAPGVQRARDAIATTVIGGYLALRDWPRQAGEGRVSVLRAILAAERRERPVTGAIVFEQPAPFRPHDGVATPGYRGAGGLFAELASDESCVPIAALATEIYLPDCDGAPYHDQIADWVLQRVVIEEQGNALFDLIAAGAGLSDAHAATFRAAFERCYRAFAARLIDPARATFSDADEFLLRPLRQVVHDSRFTGRERLGPWLSGTRHHLHSSLKAIFDYAAIAHAFRTARPLDVLRGNGAVGRVRVVALGSGVRRQRTLDLTARLVDAPDLPLDTIIVSSWARTGWNVVTPNILIDATATRDVTAWQQLRGRAMRPWPGWTADAQRLVHRLLAPEPPALDPDGLIDPNEGWRLTAEEQRILARTASAPHVLNDDTPADERERLATAIMLAENKVTHIYELVSARGSQPQVHFDRKRKHWERIDAIAEKHRHEEAVSAGDGELRAGPGHAPLIVAADPRRDLPDAFRDQLLATLHGADARIVRGWMHSIVEEHEAP